MASDGDRMSAHRGSDSIRFVVALDGTPMSERVLPAAMQYCERAGATAEVVAGVNGSPADRERVERLARECGPRVTTVDVVDQGDLAVEVIRRASAKPSSVIMMSGLGPGRTSGVFTRSLAAELLAEGAAVIFVGPRAQARRSDLPVVVLLDSSPESAQAIPMAAGWARSMRVPLVLVIITRPTLEPPLGTADQSPDPEQVIREAVADTVAAWPSLDVDGRVVSYPWRVPDAVDLYLERHPAQLVAVATHTRIGFDRLVTPSTAAKLVRELNVPILLVPIIDATGSPLPREISRTATTGNDDDGRPFRQIIVPVESELSTEASIATAEQLASAFGAELMSVESVDGNDLTDAVIDAAAATPDAVICLAAAARPFVDGVVPTETGRVIRWSPRPVVLVGPHCTGRSSGFSEVVACVDGSLVSESVAELAASWATALGIAVRVLEVTDPATTPRGATPIARSYVQRLATRLERRHGIDCNAETVEDVLPGPGIRHWASAHPDALLVMATHGHGLSEQILGSVVLDVARHATTPVVVIPAHPRGTGERGNVTDDDE